jgi:chromate transporter
VVGGLLGALAAAIGVFVPCYLFVVLPAPYYQRYGANPHIKSFVQGVTAAAAGAIGGAAFVLGKRAIYDLPTALIAVVTFAALFKLKKAPEPLLIGAAGIVGFVVHSIVHG